MSALADVFPGSAHVRDLRLNSASDRDVWNAAARDGFVVVSKDADFHQMSFVLGAPPKVVWIRLGNCSTAQIIDLLRVRASDVESFVTGDGAFLALG